MRLVIDLQGSQSLSSGKRGIGRYTRSLARAMILRASRHEVILALNGLYPDAVDEAKAFFEGLVDPGNIKVWYPPPDVHTMRAGTQRAAEKVYEAFLAQLRPDVIHVASLFEGIGEPAVTSIGSFATVPTAVTLYDLIPLVYADHYFQNEAFRSWYMRKLESLRRADAWLSISEASRQEGIALLGLDARRCTNISTAAGEHFVPLRLPAERELALRDRYGLRKPFVMYTGGIDYRKNLEGLVRAYAQLPADLRESHQLAIVCSARQEDRDALTQLARAEGLSDGTLVVTGFVPERDLIELYNLCRLFVFPSWHEGFGLPALEAMHCGAPVIAANNSSLPEVIGREDALFDPRDGAAVAAMMARGLTDEPFRKSLVEHGFRQAAKFTWDESGRRALEALEALHESTAPRGATIPLHGRRPRLAYVSPLPPDRSGVASYSAELCPYLARHYDIDLISDLPALDDRTLTTYFSIRSVGWFREHANAYDRVLYHFGNSEFHQHMFELLAEIPGTVVLHDFYLSGIYAHREVVLLEQNCWTCALYDAHGYQAAAERFHADDVGDVVLEYPCSFDVLGQAQGVIVHSPHSIALADQWYGAGTSKDWALIPHLRTVASVDEQQRKAARSALGLEEEDFLVCAFGLLGSTKLNHRLIKAWQDSTLADDPRCHLVFVGDNDPNSYGAGLTRMIHQSKHRSRIHITGWASTETFRQYLASADAAVQLRTRSRGETSGTALDTMSHGVPTIVNANGSMAYLDDHAVFKLPDDFSDAQLTHALERLKDEPALRQALSARSQQIVATQHSPAVCAQSYAHAIERFAEAAATTRDGLTEAIRDSEPLADSSPTSEIVALAESIADSLPPRLSQRQLLVDVSELVQRDARTGIQRVVKSLLGELISSPPAGFRVEPVYAVPDGSPGYRYARRFTLGFLGCPTDALVDESVNARPGDVFIGLDLQPRVVPQQRACYWKMRQMGVRVEFVVYDLLPVLLSHCFHPGAATAHEEWLKAVAENDGALCISQAVADDLRRWMEQHVPERLQAGFRIGAFHLGADVDNVTPSTGLPADAERVLELIASQPSFLMVGTLEPRKSHAQVLDAFELLWQAGENVALVIVGKQGWMVESLAARLQEHPERGRHLFWLAEASDEYLTRIYASATCLVAASEGEGFGLPLIEAARQGLPILARDLPVFREVAGEHAAYFEGDAASLAAAIQSWLVLHRNHAHPHSDHMPHLTWSQSAGEFVAALLAGPGSRAAPSGRILAYSAEKTASVGA